MVPNRLTEVHRKVGRPMRLRSMVVGTIALSLAPAFVQAEVSRLDPVPASSAAAPTRQALAAGIVDVGGERERAAKALEPVEGMISAMIVSRLSLKGAGTADQVKSIVHETLSPVAPKVTDAEIEAYAANFSSEQLRDVLAFMRSPAGLVGTANLALLKQELSAALSGSPSNAGEEAARVFAGVPSAKRELVRRILTAQDFEARTRKGYASLGAAFNAAAPRSPDGNSPEESLSGEEQARRDHAADDYVRLVMEIEQRHYVDHFSDAQLAAMADYLESDAGRAVLARTPTVKLAAGRVFLDQLAVAIPSLNGSICAAIPCSPEQRAQLADLTHAIALRLPSFAGLLG